LKFAVRWKNASALTPNGWRAQDPRQQLAAGLDGPLRPAVLLRLERVHLDRHLGRRETSGRNTNFHPFELRAVREVEVFGQRVVLPAAGVVDPGAAPDARGAVEVEEVAGAVAAPCSSTKWPSSRIAWMRVSSE
jgi:hypothetical protein